LGRVTIANPADKAGAEVTGASKYHGRRSQESLAVTPPATYLMKGLEDVAFLTLCFPDGIMGNIHVSCLDPRKTRALTVVGSEQMLIFDDMSPDAKIKIFDRRVYPGKNGEIMGYREELRIHFGEKYAPPISMEEL
jgi:predicted dehydrogenase